MDFTLNNGLSMIGGDDFTNIYEQLDDLDTSVVYIAGTQTITGDKTLSGTTTFTGSIVANSLTITPTELGYIDGLTSNAQTQITARALDNTVVHLAGTETITGNKLFSGTTTFSNNMTITGNIIANALTISPTELGYIDGLTSNAQTQITARALDNTVVHLSGAETITGVKTFSSLPESSVGVPAPTTGNQLTNKTYVDAAIGGIGSVTLAGTQTITGDKTFSGTTTYTGNIIANALTITPTELGFIDGLTSNAQTQITARALDSAVVHLTGNESIAGTKTFTTGISVNTTNRETIINDTQFYTYDKITGVLGLQVNATATTSSNLTNTLSASTVNNITNVGLAVGSAAIANSISTTGGYNRITSATTSTLANEITATGGGGNAMTTLLGGATAVRSLGTGTALFFTNSGKNTVGSTSGQVEVSTNNSGSSGILIQNTNTTTGGIRIESDGATGSLVLDSAGTLNAITSTGKNSLSSTTGDIELITGSASATGINIENTNATSGGIAIKTNGTTGDISITSGDDITIQSTPNTGGAITIEVGTLSSATGTLRLDANSGTIEINSSNFSVSSVSSYLESTNTVYAPKYRVGTFGSSQPLLSYQLHAVKRGTATSGFLLLQPSFESSTTNAQDWLILPCDVRFLRYAIMYDNDSGVNTTIDFVFNKKTSNTATPTTPYTLSFTTSVSTARTNTQGGAINSTTGVVYSRDEIIGFDYSGAPANEFGIIFYATQE